MRSRRRRGFTLLEIAIVTVITALLMLGVFSTLTTTKRVRDQTDELDRAREAARAKLELIQAQPFGAIGGYHDQTYDVPEPTDFPAGVVNTGAADHKKSWRPLRSSVAGEKPLKVLVDTGTAPAAAGVLCKVTVQVRWLTPDGQPSRLEYSTYVANQ